MKERALAAIPAERLTDARFYLEQLAETTRQMRAGLMDVLEATRRRKYWSDLFEDVNGVALKDASQRLRSPIERLSDLGILEQQEAELNELDAAIRVIPGLDVVKKKRWISLIERTKAIQRLARSCAIAMWVYVGRDSESGDIFHMEEIQSRFFSVWNNVDYPHSLTMAPPGHSKTTCMRGQIIYDLANDPSLRILILYDTDDKAKKEIGVLKSVMRTSFFRALYPEIRVLSRADDAEDSRRRFTVLRPNTGSREPSIEGAAITSQINGNGYDYIYVDDPCPAVAAQQPSIRELIIFKWNNEVEERLRNPARARIRMVCTPWHELDLAGHIQRQIREGAREGWLVAIDQFRIKDDADGKPISLWPQRFNSRYYAMKRLRLTPNEYARLYMLICRADEERLVSRLHFYPADEDDPMWDRIHPETAEAHRSRLEVIRKSENWLSVDPSATSGRSSTETAVTQIALTAQGYAFVVDAWFFPGNPVEMQEWIVQRIANGGIHRLLLEAQGGMKGMVVLWREYITRRLRELSANWTGSIIEVRTQGRGGGQNIGKRQRLTNVAAYLQRGFLRFPGRMQDNANFDRTDYVCSSRDRIQKLCSQILNFPAGATDGVDTITQFLIYNESRLAREGEYMATAADDDGWDDTIKLGMSDALKSLRNRKPETDMGREYEWLKQKIY